MHNGGLAAFLPPPEGGVGMENIARGFGRLWAAVLLTAAALLVLSGCGLRSPEELYALPRLSAEYESLQSALEGLQAQGYEYAAPTAGSNTQSVQLLDLDGDGVDEAIAYFRDTAAEEKAMKICILRFDGENYERIATIEGDGDGISSVAYCQLNDTPAKEAVVGWRIAGSVYSISAYSLDGGNVIELFSAPSYTRYQVRDMDQDNQSEIVVLQLATAEEGGNRATYYDWQDDTVMAVNTVALSGGIGPIQSIAYSNLVSNVPALFITAPLQDTANQAVTDILAVRDGMLVNITMDDDTGVSGTQHLNTVAAKDIDSDSVLELPFPRALPASDKLDNSDSFYVVDWRRYASSGRAVSVGYTYHDLADGWYLSLPGEWSADLNRLLLSRRDTNLGATVEWSITFCRRETEVDDPVPFLTISKNTGSNRASRGEMGERFLLLETEDAVYSAEILSQPWYTELEEQTIQDNFHLITTDWSTD